MITAFQYPPELLALLIDTIPLLCRSYEDTLLFFKGARVADSITCDLWNTLREDRNSINKYKIVRTILIRLNERGDSTLRERREVLKRVTEIEDFSTCWPDDQLKAKGLIAEVRRVVNVKDSFTRMSHERDRERQQHIAELETELLARRQRQESIERLKNEFFALFRQTDAQRRGKNLESVLNN
ncbi:MAG: hypothetical protein KDA52_18870, partial [Planctomycetaceae bacterium]|nr:hypothetical protein [Planctomycetaceae bacterium]